MMLSPPLAAAVLTADDPALQHKARTDLIQSDPTSRRPARRAERARIGAGRAAIRLRGRRDWVFHQA